MDVLVITRSDDNSCVDQVLHALKKRGHKGHRFDTDLYPLELQVSSEFSAKRTSRRVTFGKKRLDLEKIGAIWHRRFYAGGKLPASLGDTLQACQDESRRTLYGVVAATRVFQLDPLRSVRRADHKELQLRVARQLGLDIPRTLISNDPAAVRAFAKSLKGPVVAKMQHSFAIYRDGIENVVFTNELSSKDLEDLDGLRYSPMTFQERVPKRVELRATVVGKRVFTAAVDSNALAGAQVDWRREGRPLVHSWVHYQLPKKVEKALLALTKFFGLNYAAADFIVTPEGRHVFLEINAGGEFFWLQAKPGLPIVESLADCLTIPSRRAVPGEG